MGAEPVANPAGTLLDHFAGSIFRARGVTGDDVIYIATVWQGKLFFCCRAIVSEVCDVTRAQRLLGINDLYPAPDQVIVGESTLLNYDWQVPDAITAEIRFIDPTGAISRPVFISPGILDKQTFRSVRELTSESAHLLDGLLGSSQPVVLPNHSDVSLWVADNEFDNSEETDFESFADGKVKMVYPARVRIATL